MLPNGEYAVIDLAKLRDYVLNPQHLRGRHKARVFAAALGVRQEHAEELRARLAEAAATGTAVEADSDGFGQRFLIDFEWTRGGRLAWVRSGWILPAGELRPRFVTCFVLSK